MGDIGNIFDIEGMYLKFERIDMPEIAISVKCIYQLILSISTSNLHFVQQARYIGYIEYPILLTR